MLLQIRDLEAIRGETPNAWHIRLPELALDTGEIIALTGDSGCGKSTILEVLGLLYAPKHIATFQLADVALQELCMAPNHPKLARIRAHQIGFMLQNGGLLPFLKVRDNISLPRRLNGMPVHSQQLEQAMVELDLMSLLDLYPAQLSIGQRQRVAFIRAIAHEPKLLLADEPTAAIDPPRAAELLAIIKRLMAEQHMAAIIVSHDWNLMASEAIPCLRAELLADNQGAEFVHHVN